MFNRKKYFRKPDKFLMYISFDSIISSISRDEGVISFLKCKLYFYSTFQIYSDVRSNVAIDSTFQFQSNLKDFLYLKSFLAHLFTSFKFHEYCKFGASLLILMFYNSLFKVLLTEESSLEISKQVMQTVIKSLVIDLDDIENSTEKCVQVIH